MFEENILKTKQKLHDMYLNYLEYGFEYVKEKYDYNKSRENLTTLFKHHVPEYDKKALYLASVKIKNENSGYKQAVKNSKMSKEEKVKYFTEIWNFFKDHSFDETAKKFNWVSTRNALLNNFKNYVKEYIPAKTNRWG